MVFIPLNGARRYCGRQDCQKLITDRSLTVAALMGQRIL
jgi:hypothetical protein